METQIDDPADAALSTKASHAVESKLCELLEEERAGAVEGAFGN